MVFDFLLENTGGKNDKLIDTQAEIIRRRDKAIVRLVDAAERYYANLPHETKNNAKSIAEIEAMVEARVDQARNARVSLSEAYASLAEHCADFTSGLSYWFITDVHGNSIWKGFVIDDKKIDKDINIAGHQIHIMARVEAKGGYRVGISSDRATVFAGSKREDVEEFSDEVLYDTIRNAWAAYCVASDLNERIPDAIKNMKFES